MKKGFEKSKQRNKGPFTREQRIGKTLVLDYYPQGKSLSQKSAEAYSPVVVVISLNEFQFFDVILARRMHIEIGDTLNLSSMKSEVVKIKRIGYNELSDSAVGILPRIIKEIVTLTESRFINFLNQARPLTTQMHQLQLLPGVGNKRLWQIINARKRSEFKNFNDFTNRTGISDPSIIFTNRILQEIKGTEKYSLFIKK